MQPPDLPIDEAGRLSHLQALAILDGPQDPSFDDISHLARHLAGTEIGIISLVDRDRQWFKSCVGLPLGQQQFPRSISFCGHTILQQAPLIVEDALADPRFADNPMVLGEPGIRFYAGFPLISGHRFAIGSLCVISRQPRQLRPDQIEGLQRLAAITVQHLEHLRLSSLATQHQDGQAAALLPSASREDLRSLDRLISRDQLLQMLTLNLAMETGATYALLRCRYHDYERVSATFGGLVAEEFIDEAARRLIAALPRTASVARFADAELLALLPFDVDQEAVAAIAERIIALSVQTYRNGQHALVMTVSIGIALCRQRTDTVESILSDASMAVQMARHSVGSAYRFADAETRQNAREIYRLESDLRAALQAKRLEVHLQPIVALERLELIGFEALARWQRDDELMLPASFLPVLAESGLTAELDLLIIEKALAAMPLLARPVPQREMRISFNLSGLLLEEADHQRRLLALIEDNPCPPGWSLQVEIVEDSFRAGENSFDQFLAELARFGVVIAIDDFGTGYSSLARLISLPIRVVKLDRIFVQGLDQDQDTARTLVRTMITMLRDLGLSIIAEGVESAAQRDWLQRHGVPAAQGYLFHRPLPVSEAISLLETLEHRPRALEAETSRLQTHRRRLRRRAWGLPFLERRSSGSDQANP